MMNNYWLVDPGATRRYFFLACWTRMRPAWSRAKRYVVAATALNRGGEVGALNLFLTATDVNSARAVAQTIVKLLVPSCVHYLKWVCQVISGFYRL